MYTLKSTYEATGRTMEGFLAEIKNMEEVTDYITVNPKDIVIASYKGKKEDAETFYTLSKATMDKGIDKTGVFWPFHTLSNVSLGNPKISKDLLKESIRETGTVLICPVDGEPVAIYASQGGMNALAEKAGVGGGRITEPSTFRDIYIMEGLINRLSNLKLVIRTVKEEGRTDRKLFGVLTEKYKPISLTLIPETIDAFEKDGSMGSSSFRYWKNSQDFTEALVEFPDAAEEIMDTYGLTEALVPGIRITTSDTGDSAVRIQSTYRKEDSRTYVVKKEVKKNHMGKVTKETILEDVKKEIYSEIHELPSRLAGLMANTIGTPDVSTAEGQAANKEAVQRAIRTAARKLHIGKAIGQKRAKELVDQLEVEVVGSNIYTEYDIAMIYIGLGDRVAALPDNARKNLEKACAEAPYIKYQKSSDDEVVLLPEEV